MEIDKITSGASGLYQGSAAAAMAGTEEQSVKVPAQMVGLCTPVQNFTLDKNTANDKEQSEDIPTAQNGQLKAAVNDLNKQLKDSEAVFGVHEKTNRVTIKIVDKETKEVLKEYPPEQTLDMIAKVWEIAGILVDEKR